jgi:hypothetical protein
MNLKLSNVPLKQAQTESNQEQSSNKKQSTISTDQAMNKQSKRALAGLKCKQSNRL